MLDEKLIARIVEEVTRQLLETGYVVLPERGDPAESEPPAARDITSAACKAEPLLKDPLDREALLRMKRYTTARIGVGRSGPRLNTQTMLAMRADHAKARDSVFTDVCPELLERMGLPEMRSMCDCKDTYVTRPDLGRRLDEASAQRLRRAGVPHPDVQIFAADGLSSAAIEANLEKILPILMDGLKERGLRVGEPFYLKYGRVAAEDHVSELVGARAVCVLIGERPGLATAESMSAYIAYNAYVGMPEAKRTVVSNIHRDGLSAVEAGAYIVEVICKILEQKASGIDLVK